MPEKTKALKGKKNKVIDLKPTLATAEIFSSESNITEAQLTTSQTDWLINHGLGDKNKLSFYRRAIQDPKGSVRNPQYREYVGDVADLLFRIIWNDNQMYQRLKTLLQSKHLSEETPVENDEEDDEKDDEEDDNKTTKESVGIKNLLSILKLRI